ncbi:MAG: formate dehydrogenase accessory sulfurtransferase FdhD [Myxococcota bacterium]
MRRDHSDDDGLEVAAQSVTRRRFEHDRVSEQVDAVAAEEPLEVRLAGASLAILMRTPGHDEDLTLGFLAGEGVITGAADVRSIRHCSLARDPDADENVIQVQLREGIEVDFDALQRNFVANASCGVCGKATIEHALRGIPPIEDSLRVDAARIVSLAAGLQSAQPVFARTGGLHAAGLFSAQGRPLVVREDIGRHNAVDKVVGWALRRGRHPLRGHLLMVSGRISFEIVQKALAACIPILVAVSAPSSLAVRLAEEADMTLVAFLRGRSFNVYGRRDRIVLAPRLLAALKRDGESPKASDGKR